MLHPWLRESIQNLTLLFRTTSGLKHIEQKHRNCNKMFSDKPIRAKIGPSILNADLANLAKEAQDLVDSGADYLHLDVMDGHFVPNLTFGHPMVKCLRNNVKCAYFETHMMVSEPEKWIEPMADAKVNLYTFHIEPVSDVKQLCFKIREAGMQVGIALKPGTPIEAIADHVDNADVILVMTVEPGFGGQKFMDNMMPKVEWVREHYPNIDIEVDGGVSMDTIDCCAQAGANMIVAGTAVIQAKSRARMMKSLRDVVQDHICSKSKDNA